MPFSRQLRIYWRFCFHHVSSMWLITQLMCLMKQWCHPAWLELHESAIPALHPCGLYVGSESNHSYPSAFHASVSRDSCVVDTFHAGHSWLQKTSLFDVISIGCLVRVCLQNGDMHWGINPRVVREQYLEAQLFMSCTWTTPSVRSVHGHRVSRVTVRSTIMNTTWKVGQVPVFLLADETYSVLTLFYISCNLYTLSCVLWRCVHLIPNIIIL